MIYQTLTEYTKALAEKKISSREITQYFLERIKKLDRDLNAFITVSEEEALKAAHLSDLKRAQGEVDKLCGVPLACKDMFLTEGVRTTCASKMLANFIPPYDATVVARLKNAGVVFLGKTNMDEFAMGSSTETSYFGPVKNPWDKTRVPGGSSGGSAASVAAGLAPAALGTDTGGSIRQPAAFTGISGLKPTYGRVSRYGMVAFASSLDQAGIFAKTAEDIALLLQVMAGFDPLDSTSSETQVPHYADGLNRSLKGIRFGLPKTYFNNAGLDQGIVDAIQVAIKEYEKLGASFTEIDLPHNHLSIPVYYIIAPAECSSNLARYDGIRFGYRCDLPSDLMDLYERSRSEGFGSEVKRRIMMGTYVLSAGYYEAYYLKAQKIRRLILNDFLEAFKKVDVILGPTTPTVAFAINEIKDPLHMYLSDIFTIAVNLAGLPGMSIPIGFSKQLPIGMQLIANFFEESRLLNVAHALQKITPWHTFIPEGFA